MIQLTKIEDLIGKTIVNIAIYEKFAALFFNDSEMVLFSVDRGYDYGDEEIFLCAEADFRDLCLEEKYRLKIITETEYNALTYGRLEKQRKAQEEEERRQYEFLKKKFGEG